MSGLKVVLLTESDSLKQDVPLLYNSNGQKLWDTIRSIVSELHYCCETVELNKLDFQEHESVNKFLNAAIVIMDVTNQDCRPSFMYHKGNRESVDCIDDIVLIQASGLENDNTIQDLKTTCKIKQLIVYRYDEKKDSFYDVTTPTNPPTSLKKNLKHLLREAANNMQQGLSTRYLNLMEKRKNNVNDKNAERIYLWKEICDEILTETNQRYATPKLIISLMYAFRDIQDYQSMIELIERCEQYETISMNIQNNMLISYLTAFARSRRNENNDRDKALEILERLCQTKRTESELSNDIICLRGRIYKDKYTESNCQDKDSLEKAIEWYRKGFAADPNIYAGINLLLLLAITTDDLIKNNEAYKIIIQLNALLGKKGRSLKDLNDYWDVATYFELHAVQHDWLKACQAALHMYSLNPPIWYLKSTINNLKILHQATRIRVQQRPRESSQTTSAGEDIYSFWIDFFSDAINSHSTSTEERELPAQVPTTCKIKQLIVYRYDEKKDSFYDVTTPTNPPTSLKKNLKHLLREAANNMQQGLSTRYLNLMEKRKNNVNDKNAERIYLWKEICDEILTETNQRYATPKLIISLMYAFRDIQDYQSMIELIERCEQYETISMNIQNNMLISYLTAFARSRRNENNDRDKALEILERLCQTKRTESELSNDIICLRGRIYKDKYTESNCQDKDSLEKAIEWYRKGFAADPNIYAGINLLLLLAITTDDLIKNNEAYKIIIQLNALLGKKGRSLKDLNDYWDVATYFELHAVQHDWLKACQAALHMYSLNPPIWYLKSTINNLKILHQATRIRVQRRPRESSQTTSAGEDIYSFWIDFFSDAINSHSTSTEERELPAQVPILVCENYEKTDGTILNNIYIAAYLQLNFHTGSERETLVIRILEQQKQIHH
ncbi:unnamed protein product, partial [Adineta steineri]